MKLLPEALFAALSNPIRLRCLMLLEHHGELCVCELTHALNLAQPTISRHLAQLREAGLVRDRREGLWVHYRIHPDLPEWGRKVLRAARDGSRTRQPFQRDRKRLQDPHRHPLRRGCA